MYAAAVLMPPDATTGENPIWHRSSIPHASYLRDGPRGLELEQSIDNFYRSGIHNGNTKVADDVIRFTVHRFDFKEICSDQWRFAAATSISLSVCSYMQPCWSTWEKNFMS